jgi:S1-C subfamily serine protease
VCEVVFAASLLLVSALVPGKALPQGNVVVGGELQAKADSGDTKAAYTLGMRYFMGENITRNRDMARHYLLRAAEGGDLRAMNMLGLMSDPLWSDDTKAKDLPTAVGWYRRAALQGYEPALSNLSELRRRGYIKSEMENGLVSAAVPAQAQSVAPVIAPAPVATPVNSPAVAAAAPVSAPVTTSDAATVAAPVTAPLSAPVSAPVTAPLSAPVGATAAAPVAQPTSEGAVAQQAPIANTALNFPLPNVPNSPAPERVVAPQSLPPAMDGREMFKARSSSLVEILGDGQYGSGVILGTLWMRAEDATLRTALQDLMVSYPFMSSSQAYGESTMLPPGSYLVVVSNAHVMEGTRKMEIGYGVDPRGQTVFKKTVAGVCFPSEANVDLAIFFVPVDANELGLNGVISAAPLPPATVVPEPGSRVYAIANPERMARSIAQGLLSGLRPDLLQFDAPISKGSSGGAIFDERGQLLGVILGYLNEAGAQNINFAIPTDRIRPLMMGSGALCYRTGSVQEQGTR